MSWVLLRYELLGLVRDTRTLILTVLLPILLLPAMLLTLQRSGPSRSGGDAKDPFLFACTESSSELSSFLVQALGGRGFRESGEGSLRERLQQGRIDLGIELGEPEERGGDWSSQLRRTFPALAPLWQTSPPGRPVLVLLYRGDRDRSVRAFLAARERLEGRRLQLVEGLVEQSAAGAAWQVRRQDVSSQRERDARRYGPALSAFMLLVLLGGGSVAALDSMAGERERGTLVTLFVSALPRREIVLSKFLAVALVSVAVALAQMVNLALYIWLGWVPLVWSGSWGETLSVLAGLTVLFLAEAVLTAAFLLWLSARSQTFKEAQLFFFPAFLVCLALSLTGLVSGLSARSVVGLIPLAGAGVAIPELLAGRLDPALLALITAVHLAAAAGLLASILREVNKEEFLGGPPQAVGEALRFERFSQRALPTFALMAAALMVVPSNLAWLSTLVGQSLFNQVVLFVLVPLGLLKLFGQPWSRAVPFRPISPAIAVACLGLVPLGQVAATGLSHALGPLLPPPVKAMEQMMEFLQVGSTPAWQIVLLIGVLPGICEEIAFRGVLLYALHKRFTPWVLAAVVALVFGLFHLNFYRVLPTAYLGFFLTLLTLGTGSLWPAVLVHIGNNSLAVFALLHGWDFEGLGPQVYLLGFVGQVLLTGCVLRWGAGYPGTSWAQGPRAQSSVALSEAER